MADVTPINNMVITVVSLAIGVILIATLLIPIAQEYIDELTTAGNGTWASLLGVVIIVSIIGLVLVAVNGFMNDRRGVS